ncbi:MAG TPA: alpha/beta fold hydrolase [Stellaceae bacterium]|nr:alpha/beta fold hydrolase [Stellaceae bacterium]
MRTATRPKPVAAAPPPPASPPPLAAEPASTEFDRLAHAWQARFTLSISPAALWAAFADWAAHLANAPGKQLALVEQAAREGARLAGYVRQRALGGDPPACIEPSPHDRRFSDAGWRQPPFDAACQAFLFWQKWWHEATAGVPGVASANERIVAFTMRQVLDLFSPANWPFSHPTILRATAAEGGQNLVRGLLNLIEDWQRLQAGRRPVGCEAFRPGREVALTPGKVVYRNELIELLQYAPTTESARPEPVLIVPAWIMKYYILDLSPENSLARRLVESGFSVFMISWRNPGAEQRNLGMEDYRRLGIEAALKAIGSICGGAKVHGCGYCLGGTLLAIAAAQMARDDDHRLASISLLAAQTDFSEAGELMLFVNRGQIAFLEDAMWERGYLDARQMAGAFQMLRSNDLIWSEAVRQYMLGARRPLTDLTAWNADATRMPYRMQSEYLRRLFLGNDLAEGRHVAEGRPVALSDIRVPIFAVGTESDHVAPWRSVFKIELLTDAEVTFVLTTGGHNVGILGLPERRQSLPARSFRIAGRPEHGHHPDPESWIAAAERREGSWWPAWISWLGGRSGKAGPPPGLGAPEKGYPILGEAPGTYVLEP